MRKRITEISEWKKLKDGKRMAQVVIHETTKKFKTSITKHMTLDNLNKLKNELKGQNK